MIFGGDLAKRRFFMLGRWLVELSLNGLIMWAGTKGKVNDVNGKRSCRGEGWVYAASLEVLVNNL